MDPHFGACSVPVLCVAGGVSQYGNLLSTVMAGRISSRSYVRVQSSKRITGGAGHAIHIKRGMSSHNIGLL